MNWPWSDREATVNWPSAGICRPLRIKKTLKMTISWNVSWKWRDWLFRTQKVLWKTIQNKATMNWPWSDCEATVNWPTAGICRPLRIKKWRFHGMFPGNDVIDYFGRKRFQRKLVVICSLIFKVFIFENSNISKWKSKYSVSKVLWSKTDSFFGESIVCGQQNVTWL